MAFSFQLLSRPEGQRARLGRILTDHGPIETPVFMPVGTAGTVKALNPQQLEELDAQIILGNTYHLYLRPGTSLLKEAGGLHKFMNWKRPILTDSGGFQVWSLKELRKIKPEGVEFASHLDGSRHLFTPASVMRAQREIGADIMMAFDECTPFPSTLAEARHSLDYTKRWTEEAVDWLAQNPPLYGYDQALFGIVQGGMHLELREEAIAHLAAMDLPGYALGGLSVGEPAETMYAVAEHCDRFMPEQKPRYVMGVGTPGNLLNLVSRGMDMFDCVLPSRNARNGVVFTWGGKLPYKAGRFARVLDQPLDSECSCYTCRNFSRAYLRHLFNAEELLVHQLATIHNLHFYQELMKRTRTHLREGDFAAWRDSVLPRLEGNAE
jgi:queuine tRNA-ribosyltransferase